MTRTLRAWAIGFVAVGVLAATTGAVLAQTQRQTGQQQQVTRPAGQQQQPIRQQQTPPPERVNPRAGGRGALPPITPNMNQQQLQAWIDTYAVVQAERDLQLTADQYPAFVGRLRKVQDIRRRNQMEKGKLLRELNGLLQINEAREEAILAHVKSLDDLAQRGVSDLKQAYQDLDSGLTPWQRGRLRLFEEQLERRKMDLLSKINAANPGRGGDGGN
jgi:hypothetical protein